MRKLIARQPIFDRRQNVFAYELLFRTSLENYFQPASPNADGSGQSVTHAMACNSVLVDGIMVFSLEELTYGHKAFINFTSEALVRDYALLLPHHFAVVELLENIEPDEAILAACRRLKQAGYRIALDDFSDGAKWQPLASLADYIKVDFRRTSPEDRCGIAERYATRGVEMVAEKVETYEQFQEAFHLGYSYFQGFFFCRPQIVTGRDIPALKLNYVRILQATSGSELDFGRIEQIIKQEPSLCYKLLRYVNSPLLGFPGEIHSIHHALALLGEKELRKWVMVVAAVVVAEDKPQELIQSALVRAHFCECLAPYLHLDGRETELFLLGLFSMMDAILSRPLKSILSEVPLPGEVVQAFRGEENRLHDVYKLVVAYDLGDWVMIDTLAARLHLEENDIPECYLKSLQKVRSIFSHG